MAKAKYDFRAVDAFEGEARDFLLSPKKWRTFATRARLDWEYVQFTKRNRHDVPSARGIYAFVIEHCDAQFPAHGYIMYVGITGHTAGNRTLRSRYAEYLRGIEREKRERVRWMLNKFRTDLYFHFAVIPDQRLSLTKLETALLNAINPPCNKKDFSGGRIKTERAFR
jgi:hypothetical protein